MIALAAMVISWMDRQPKSMTFSGCPKPKLAVFPACPVSVELVA